MSGNIYLIENNHNLRPMTESPFDNEDILQTLIEKYPELLAGDQMPSDTPRRWLLISREMGVADKEGGADRWSLDHLFVDQDAIPTLVEVKRSSDTRIRREVVGQMFDYAANAVVYWPIEVIKNKFERTCEAHDSDPVEKLDTFLNPDSSPEEKDEYLPEKFWESVETNLQAGKIRLVFLADQIPTELQRIVEFLNDHMDRVEVLAVELRQYVGEGVKTLVPRVLGQTAASKIRKAPHGEAKKWNEELFAAELKNNGDELSAQTIMAIYEWIKPKATVLIWGKGAKLGSVTPGFERKDGIHRVVRLLTSCQIEIPFDYIRNTPYFKDDNNRLELLNRLNAIDGINLPKESIDKYPKFDSSALNDSKLLDAFITVLEWVLSKIEPL